MHKNDHSPPPAAFVGRIRYAPTLLKNLKSKNKNESGTRVGAYCIRPINILSRNILSFKIHVFAASGSVWWAYAIRPYIWRHLKTKPQKQKRNSDHVGILEIRFFSCLVFFSCLDARKEPKENQAPCRGRGSLAWYMFRGTYAFAPLHILVH